MPENYRLGVGDRLQVVLIGKEKGEYALVVGRDGSITFPQLGSINLNGLTFEQSVGLINARVEEQMIGTEAIVSMDRLRNISIFMAGEVENPGSYSVSALSTVSQALYLSGGITEVRSYRDIQVRRSGEIVGEFTYTICC